MATLITFIFGLVAVVGGALANAASYSQGQAAIGQIVATLPTDLGTMLVGFLNGAAGLMTAVGGLF
jgi:hypothetical protein